MSRLKSQVEGSPAVVGILCGMESSRTVPSWLHERSSIILKTIEGLSVAAIVADVGATAGKVNAWRRRWRSSRVWLAGMEKDAGDSRSKLVDAVLTVLGDRPRSGKPPKFTGGQLMQIVEMACEPPADHGLPQTAWTNASLAGQAAAKGIVDSISASQVWRTLKKCGLAAAQEQVLDGPPDR